MTVKQYLRQLSRIQQNIRILGEEIEVRRAKLTSTTVAPSGERVQASSSGDRFADMMAALADKELQQRDMLYGYMALRDKIVGQILELENETHSRILYERYVQEKRWETIAEELHYNRQHVCRIHGRALVKFAEKFGDEL